MNLRTKKFWSSCKYTAFGKLMDFTTIDHDNRAMRLYDFVQNFVDYVIKYDKQSGLDYHWKESRAFYLGIQLNNLRKDLEGTPSCPDRDYEGSSGRARAWKYCRGATEEVLVRELVDFLNQYLNIGYFDRDIDKKNGIEQGTLLEGKWFLRDDMSEMPELHGLRPKLHFEWADAMVTVVTLDNQKFKKQGAIRDNSAFMTMNKRKSKSKKG